jgi:hypothetical protein
MSDRIEEYQYAIDAIEMIIDKVAEKHTFVTMLRQLAESAEVDLMRNDCIFVGPLLFTGDYKEWLHHSFSSMFRVDINREKDRMPPEIRWCVAFRQMRFKLSQKMCYELMVNDIEYWSETLTNSGDKSCPLLLSVIPVVDLGNAQFSVKTI